MKQRLLKLVLAFSIASCLLPVSILAAQEQKIGASLQIELAMAGSGGKVPVIVRMKDPLAVQSLATPTRRKGPIRAQARANLIHALKARADQGQQPLKKLLAQRGITKFQQLWLINGMALLATPAQVEEISRLPEVASIVADHTIELPGIVPAQVSGTAEPNIDQVNASALWALGYAGQGVTVAIVDSGVDASHPDLGPRWRGGANSWYDPNGEHTDAPTDMSGHGTEVTGLVLGGASSGTYIGVAPEAQWIGVKIFADNDSTTFSTIHLGLEWLLDPDSNPDTDDAPDIVNNSWGFEYAANECLSEFQQDVQNLKAAGIALVFSAGNTGLSGSVSPGNYQESFAVGSVDLSSVVSDFSARGPSACDADIYPEVVAPGDHVKTSSLGSTYVLAEGTSLAASHASGVMALLLSAFPETPVDTLETALKNSAIDLGTLGADNTYGYGLINSLEAFNYLGGLQGIAVTDSISPETDNDVAFGSVVSGESITASVRVRNTGSLPLILGAADLSNIAEPFSVVSDACSGKVLTSGETCSFTLQFSPTVPGSFSGSLVVLSNAVGEERVTMNVSGTAVSVPDITVIDSVVPINDLQISFGTITVGSSSDQFVFISNDGNADLAVGSIASADLLEVPFTIQNDTCSGQTLMPAASCSFNVRFTPAAGGVFNDSFDIPSNDPDENPVTVTVSGTGTVELVPAITVTDTSAPFDDRQVLFGDVTEGVTADHTVTISNDGNAALALGNLAVANPLAEPFSLLNDTCSGHQLQPATGCTFDVRFAPAGASSYTDSFDIPSSDPDESSLIVNLSGSSLSAVTNNPPDIPQLASPANGQQQVSSVVTFEWLSVTDPDGDPVNYDIYYCTSADPFSNCNAVQITTLSGQPDGRIYYAGISSGAVLMFLGVAFAGRLRGRKKIALLIVVAIGVGTLLAACHPDDPVSSGTPTQNETYTVSGLGPATLYYWGVVAKDGQGGETQSAVWSFTTL
ncbi:MAG: S8 family serine peptidase [Desulfuromonadales bacterium]